MERTLSRERRGTKITPEEGLQMESLKWSAHREKRPGRRITSGAALKNLARVTTIVEAFISG